MLQGRKQLIDKIVERVFVHNRKILALVLYGDFAVFLDGNEMASSELVDAIERKLIGSENLALSDTKSDDRHCGSDGVRLTTESILMLPKSRFKKPVHVYLRRVA